MFNCDVYVPIPLPYLNINLYFLMTCVRFRVLPLNLCSNWRLLWSLEVGDPRPLRAPRPYSLPVPAFPGPKGTIEWQSLSA